MSIYQQTQTQTKFYLMKKFLFVLLLCLSLGACQKDEEISPMRDEESSSVQSSMEEFEADESVVSSDTSSDGIPKSNMTEYAVSPKFGVPNSTYYDFKVYDPAGSLSLSVKLYEKATGAITYLSMSRIGNYWKTSKKISKNGWYDYRYVYSASHNNISTKKYVLCNTYNTFSSSSSGTNHIYWPFGADGSSWNNRTINNQTWRGGEETKPANNPFGSHIGYGWNEGTHTGSNERYSDDWNRGNNSDDNGAIIRSPLDGYVEEIDDYPTNSGSGSSHYIAIVQEGSNGQTYRFYVGHLKYQPTNVSVGDYVRAGVTKIGVLGKSGATGYHAHTNLRKGSSSVRFSFDAN